MAVYIQSGYAMQAISYYWYARLGQPLQTLSPLDPVLPLRLSHFKYDQWVIGFIPPSTCIRQRDFGVFSQRQHLLFDAEAITQLQLFRTVRVNQQNHTVAVSKFIGFCFRLSRTNLHITQSHDEYPFKGSVWVQTLSNRDIPAVVPASVS